MVSDQHFNDNLIIINNNNSNRNTTTTTTTFNNNNNDNDSVQNYSQTRFQIGCPSPQTWCLSVSNIVCKPKFCNQICERVARIFVLPKYFQFTQCNKIQIFIEWIALPEYLLFDLLHALKGMDTSFKGDNSVKNVFVLF